MPEMHYRPVAELHEWADNPRSITKESFERLKKQIQQLGQYKPLLILEDGTVIGGNMRLKAYRDLGITDVWVSIIHPKDNNETLEYALSDNDRAGFYDEDLLANLMPQYPDFNWGDYAVDLGDPVNLQSLLDQYSAEDEKHADLTEKFIIPPFSVFDTRQGYWQNRKNSWIDLGIRSEIGRQGTTLFNGPASIPNFYNFKKEWEQANGRKITNNECFEIYKKNYKGNLGMADEGNISVFDPVLCEIIYRWFNVPGGSVLDPFAGGSVRGIVADKLGYPYTGIELSKEQVASNNEQADEIGLHPTWIIGDSNVRLDQLSDKYDLVFSCPPYEDLEVYSDDPADLSNMDSDSFNKIYASIIKKAVDHLKDNRFACFVVTEVRGKNGMYTGLVARTIRYFEEAGARFYNDAILYNVAGSLPMRAGRQFNISRKLGKTHQNVLVFYKGDPKQIKANYSELDFSEVSEPETQN